MNSIIWRGVSSTTIQGLLISELPSITKPEMRIAETVINGRDGSFVEELGYSSYVKTIIIGLHGNFDINKVIKYFTGDGDIVFSNEPDKVYKAKICGRIDYTRLLRYRQASISFLVQPFKYKLNEYLRETPTATASGISIVVNDSADAKLKDFKIYGKSTQDGTPTPEAPIDIVSLGADNLVNAKFNGINLFNLNSGIISGTTQSVTFIDNGFVLDASVQNTRICRFKCNLIKGNTYFLSCDIKNISGVGEPRPYLPKLEQYLVVGRPFTPAENTDELGFFVSGASIPTVAEITNIQVSLSNEKKDYEAFTEQSATITVNNGLKGIPITDQSLATYTDASGQMWYADEIDLERGVLVKRTKEVVFNGTETWTSNSNYTYYVRAKEIGCDGGLCDKLPSVSVGSLLSLNNSICATSQYNGVLYCRLKDYMTEDTVDAFKLALAQHPITVIYALATPIETPLTEEEIAIYKALKTNEPTTTIQNDENAYMSVEYFKPFEVFNEGLEDSKPLMILKGSGTVEISVNGTPIFSYTFPENENEVYIDSEIEDAYLENALKNRNMNGEFPILIPKTNIISWSGDIESISILPRSRWL